jgi:transposase
MASAKAAMRALARRWLWLHEEIITHEKELERLVTKCAPDLMTSQGITTLTVAEMLVVVGGDPTRIRSEAAFAKLCGVCPIPASSGKTHRFRFNRGGNRQANAALHRVAIVRIRSHEPTLLMCSIPDDHIDPRRSGLFKARLVLRDIQMGDANVCSTS